MNYLLLLVLLLLYISLLSKFSLDTTTWINTVHIIMIFTLYFIYCKKNKKIKIKYYQYFY